MDRDEAMAQSFAACRTWEEIGKVAGMWTFGELLAEILTTPPPVREHWWQLWRNRG